MVKTLVGALVLASLPSALAFRNTSPFFLFSTSALDITSDGSDIAQSNVIEDQVKEALQSCPSKAYLIARQEGVSALDYVDGRSAPRLGRYMSGKEAGVKSTMIVPEVLQTQSSGNSLSRYLQTKCNARVLEGRPSKSQATDGGSWIIEVSLPAPSSSDRAAGLEKNDVLLEQYINELAFLQDYTVLYTSTPPSEEQAKAAFENQRAYEMEDPFGGAVQMEMKRDLLSHKRAASTEGGLFEKYQFLSPPLFMGFVAILPLFAIVFVGVKALSSLEVSYFAFSKEMGPAAQRKQQ